MPCTQLAATFSSLVVSPASYRSTARPSRSSIASLATRSRSVAAPAAVSSAIVARSRSARAAKPAGLRSVSSPSWPPMPTSVACTGSSSASRSVYRSAISVMVPMRSRV